jgi:TonB family protein
VKPFVRFHETFDPEIVTVGVTIDAKGVVTEAHELSPVARNSELRSRALVAAKQWKFRPAQREGENVLSEFTLQFRFTKGNK